METYADALRIASLVAYTGLGAATLLRWRRHRAAPDAWAAATFLTLAAVAIVSRIAGSQGETAPPSEAVTKLLLVGIVLFPYLLFRFLASFGRVPRWLEWSAAAATAAVAIWSALLAEIPEPGSPRSPAFQAYVNALLVQWVGLFSVVGVRLWRAGARQTSIVRRRMRLLAIAATGMSVAIVLSAARESSEVNSLSIGTQILSLASAILFALGLAPPRVIRTLWRRKEEESIRRTIRAMMRATEASEVANLLLPAAAGLVGAPYVRLADERGTAVAAYGAAPGEGSVSGGAEHHLPLRAGQLVVSTSHFTPFFGADELGQLEVLADLADVAIERCTHLEREREFISNAAHELRTPMTTVYGIAMTLESHPGAITDGSAPDAVQALVRQSLRAKSLIDDLLDLARIEGDTRSLKPAPVEATAVISRALGAAPPPDGVTVDVLVDERVHLLADPLALERIMVNLLTNAYRYCGATVRIETAQRGHDVALVVSDDGQGVAPSLIPVLFEPFARADGDRAAGSGLGLAISRRLAQAMEGDVTYERRDGARFTVSLPGVA